MTNRPDIKFRSIHNEIKEHFHFLFKLGFRITGAILTGGSANNWVVTMLAGDCFIRVHCDHGRLGVGLTTLRLFDRIGFLDLRILLKSLGEVDDTSCELGTMDMKDEPQFKSMAYLLGKYLRRIVMQLDNLNISFLEGPDGNINGQLSMDNCPSVLFPFQV